MNTLLKVTEFLNKKALTPLVDVRTPAEFEQGHIPGAINIPLFSDEERVVVGTLYKKKGKDHAVEKGLEFVGPKLADFVRKAKKIAPGKKILVHCWRGGMRSASMAILFRTAGLQASCLDGGYKAYRTYLREKYDEDINLLVLGGMTGSGKTDILHKLKAKGEQVIDLEGIANHKGSAFGALGQEEQPTSEQFDNELFEEWNKLDKSKIVWIEDESRSIGKVWLNEILYDKIRTSRILKINIPKAERIKRLLDEYGKFDKEIAKEILLKISKRLGKESLNQAFENLDNNRYDIVAEISLNYYDKAYMHGLEKRKDNKIYDIELADNNAIANADKILEYCIKNKI